MAAAAGLQEMLLASYNDVIEIMPAVPASWQKASFRGLRAEGAFIVSAQRQDGRITQVEIVAERGGVLKMKNPFSGKIDWKLKKARLIQEGDTLIFSTEKDGKITATNF